MLKRIAHFIATVGYAGHLPKMPGTWGSLVAIPLFYLLPKTVFMISIPILFFVGWAATYILLKNDPSDKDPSHVVIDELYAMMLVFAFCPQQQIFWNDPYYYMLIGFLFVGFRYFDIAKPWPIHDVDAYFKNKGPFGASFGVMIDDLLAAIFSLLLFIVFLSGFTKTGGIIKVNLAPHFLAKFF
ncbi:MAG: phosphatidylglycerophosphatase A [Alphaproteobacteria bacterium]|nr:phosphatidylglycerophosphatase A [Alphaproteobacteria bacterium]